MARSYTTKHKEGSKPVRFELDGREMEFTAPKAGGLLMALTEIESSDPQVAMAGLRGLLDWLGAGLSDEDGEWILARLRDPEDDFDVDDTIAVVNMLVSESAERPTTPPSASSESPDSPSLTDGRPIAVPIGDPST